MNLEELRNAKPPVGESARGSRLQNGKSARRGRAARLKKRMPAGRCEARKKHENKALQRQQQGWRGEVSQGVKMAELVIGLAIRVALMAGKQQAQEAGGFVATVALAAIGGFTDCGMGMRQMPVVNLRRLGRARMRVNCAVQKAKCLCQQQHQRKRNQPGERPASPGLAKAQAHRGYLTLTASVMR